MGDSSISLIFLLMLLISIILFLGGIWLLVSLILAIIHWLYSH